MFCRCQVEYQQRDAAARGDAEAQKKLHSFVLFLGELYLNLEVNVKCAYKSERGIIFM